MVDKNTVYQCRYEKTRDCTRHIEKATSLKCLYSPEICVILAGKKEKIERK